MTSGLAHNPELVVLHLRPLADVLYPAYEVGHMAARQFFEERGEPTEPYHYASTVRYAAKQYIRAHGVSAEYDAEDVANNGLKFTYGPYAVRCRKVDRRERDGMIVLAPSPSDSLVMQDFYAQQIQPGLPGTPTHLVELNVLILWDYSGGFVQLYLSCPAAGHSRRSVEEYFWRPLPHPADSATASTAVPPAGDDGTIGYEPAPEPSEDEDEGAEHG
jgi:hypothetical protein